MAGVHEMWGTPGAFLGLLFLNPAKDLSHVVRFWPRRRFSCKQTAVLKKRIDKTTPLGVNLMRSRVLYRAAQIEDSCLTSAGQMSV